MQKPAWSKDARTGPLRSYMQLRVFACEGLVCLIDERPGEKEGEYIVVTPHEMRERLDAINAPYRNQTRAQLPKWQRQEFDERTRGSQNCMECIKEAEFMGDPSDPVVQAFWARHRRSNTFKFSFSAGSDLPRYPKLPALNYSDGEPVPVGEPVVADHLKIHTPPRRKRAGHIIL